MTIGVPLAVREIAAPNKPFDLLYASIENATVLSCLRVYGQKTTAEVEYAFGLQQQALLLARIDSNLLAGDLPPAQRCAAAQALTDTQHGRKPLIQTDAHNKVWLSYQGLHWLGHGLICPSASPAVLDIAVGQAWFRARHAQTAAIIGGPCVKFVHTHDMTAGDAFDAGYFVDTSTAVSETYEWQPQTLPVFSSMPIPLPEADLSAADPTSGLALRMSVLAEILGIVGAVAVVEHAWRIILGAYWSWLPRVVGIAEVSSPLQAAQLYAAFISHEGLEVRLEDKGDCVLIHHHNNRWESQGVPRKIVDSMVRAWSSILPNFCWSLRAVVVSDGAEPLMSVKFDLLGPES